MSKNKNNLGKIKRDARRDFLMLFMTGTEGYSEQEVRGFYLVRYFDSSNKRWNVAVYSPESFVKMSAYKTEKDSVDRLKLL